MKRIFVDEYGVMRLGWMLVIGFAALGAILWTLFYTEGKHKAEFYTQLTGKPMSVSDAFWISPQFNVSAGGEVTVKVEEK